MVSLCPLRVQQGYPIPAVILLDWDGEENNSELTQNKCLTSAVTEMWRFKWCGWHGAHVLMRVLCSALWTKIDMSCKC